MNWSAVDLNLMRVLDAMMIERNTTRAGERLGLSQPAVSSAIGRLRHITGDALFVREGNRMVPTTRAVQISEPIRAALRQIETALSETASFEPETAADVFRLLGSDYFSSLLMPALARAVKKEAPGVTLQMLDRPSAAVVPSLSDGSVDLAVDSRLEVPDWVNEKVLFQSYVTTVARTDDPMIAAAGLRPGERLPPDLFCALPHVLMSMDGGRTGTIDRVLEAEGLTRRVSLTVPHFHAVALAVAEAGLIGSLPVHFARRIAPLLDLAIYLPPFEPPRLDVMLYWHCRRNGDASLAWLRQQIIREFAFDTVGDLSGAAPACRAG